jgi:hypothetical protein
MSQTTVPPGRPSRENRRFGRLPADPTRPRLLLGPILKAVPDHPATVDYGTKIPNPGMRLNDKYGCCVAATWANNRFLVTTALTESPRNPSDDEVIAVYKTQNPGFPHQDDGMVIQTLLEYLNKTGGPDGTKAVAFAAVDYTNPDELRAAVAIFGGIWYGVNVTQANETEFDQGQAWDYKPQSQVLGGHAILGPGYDPRIRFITWNEETEFTDAFINKQMEEAWVVIWPEHLGSQAFQEGVDLEELAADYKALTGKDLPVPPAPPTPPKPDPGSDPYPGADPVVAHLVEDAAQAAGLSTSDWLNKFLRNQFSLS